MLPVQRGSIMSRGDSIQPSTLALAPLNSDFDKIDFSRPDRFMREIVSFVSLVTQENDLGIKSKGRQINAQDAQTSILLLLQLVVPNLHVVPGFNPREVQNLFATLSYPYTIRADAIQAVGAPSSIYFLMRAIFWLYLAVRTLYKKPSLRFDGAVLPIITEDRKSHLDLADEAEQKSDKWSQGSISRRTKEKPATGSVWTEILQQVESKFQQFGQLILKHPFGSSEEDEQSFPIDLPTGCFSDD